MEAMMIMCSEANALALILHNFLFTYILESRPQWRIEYSDSFSMRIFFRNNDFPCISISKCKYIESNGSDTTTIETALVNSDGSLTYNHESGYDDVKCFDNYDDLIIELNRISNFSKNKNATI